jgi:hypothetical protein
MRAREFINEAKYGNAGDVGADPKLLAQSQISAIKGAITMPDISINKQNGSPYMQWRFGIAMAGAPDYNTPPAGAMAGDPLLATYTQAELDIINAAAKMVGAGEVKQITDNRSRESEFVNKQSPVKGFKGYAKK